MTHSELSVAAKSVAKIHGLTQASKMYPPLYILDPGCFTPAYDANLISALARRGWQPRWATSLNGKLDVLWRGALTVEDSFFGFLGSPGLKGMSNHSFLRRAAKCASYPHYLASFSNRLLAGTPGVVHVQWALLPLLDSLYWRSWRRRGWIVAYTEHDPKPLSGTLPRILTRWHSRLWEESDAVIVHSHDGAEILLRSRIKDHSLHLIPPGPPTVSEPIPSAQARAALKIPQDLPVILFLGYIKRYKGLEFLLRSLPPLSDILGPFLCIVAGEFKEPAKRYQALISKLQLQNYIRLLDGYVPEKAMSLYFSACDVVVLPYTEASSSGILLCAYSFGKPVVATATGGNSELVEDGNTGYLVAPGESMAMARALSAVLKDPRAASNMGARGRDMIKFRYSWDRIAERTEQVYLSLGSRGKANVDQD